MDEVARRVGTPESVVQPALQKSATVEERSSVRGRPRKCPGPAECDPRSFEQVLAQIKAISDGGPWHRAKESAIAAAYADEGLPQPSSGDLFRAMLNNFNRRDGLDFGGRAFYAGKCGLTEPTVRKRWKALSERGHILRRRVKRPSQYDLWQTTFPALVPISGMREAKNPKPGGQIIDSQPLGGRPFSLLIPFVGVVTSKREESQTPLKVENGPSSEPVPGLPTQGQLHAFNQLANRWSGRPTTTEITTAMLSRIVAHSVQREAADVVEKALDRTLAICLEEASHRSRDGKLASYFSSVFDGQLHEQKKRRLVYESELCHAAEQAQAKHDAALKILQAQVASAEGVAAAKIAAEVATGEGIKQRRHLAMDDAIAANKTKLRVPSTATRAHSKRYITADDGREVFEPNTEFSSIAFAKIRGVHANRLLDGALGSTVQDVEHVLMDISEDFPCGPKDPPVAIAQILEKATSKVREIVAHRQHGAPEQLCGGMRATSLVRCPWAALSQVKLDALKKACPLVGLHQIHEIWMEVCGYAHANWKRYGAQLQVEIETRFEQLMRAAKESNTQQEQRERELEAARAKSRAEEKRSLEEKRRRSRRKELEDVAYDRALEHPEVQAARLKLDVDYGGGELEDTQVCAVSHAWTEFEKVRDAAVARALKELESLEQTLAGCAND